MDIDRFEATIHSADGVLPLQEFVSHFQFKPGQALHIVCEPTSKATEAQNDQQHAWFKEAHRQNPQYSAEEYRGMSKAYCGIPILCRDSADYRAAYDRVIRPLDRETKIFYMMRPLDFPVTRGMNKKQKSEYLDAVYVYLTTEHGIRLERQAA